MGVFLGFEVASGELLTRLTGFRADCLARQELAKAGDPEWRWPYVRRSCERTWFTADVEPWVSEHERWKKFEEGATARAVDYGVAATA